MAILTGLHIRFAVNGSDLCTWSLIKRPNKLEGFKRANFKSDSGSGNKHFRYYRWLIASELFSDPFRNDSEQANFNMTPRSM